MTGSKIDKIKQKYINMTTARGRGRKSHDDAVEILRDMFCEGRSTILGIVSDLKAEEIHPIKPIDSVKAEISTNSKVLIPDSVIEALQDALTDYVAQQKAYFDHFERVDDNYIDLNRKIEDISLYLSLIKAEREMQV